jgi:hypothetical protein
MSEASDTSVVEDVPVPEQTAPAAFPPATVSLGVPADDAVKEPIEVYEPPVKVTLAAPATEAEEDTAPIPTAEVAAGSLQDRLAERRKAISKVKIVDIPLPGYEDLLVGRYKRIGYEPIKGIADRASKNPNEARGEVVAACDTLIQACVTILQVESDGSLKDLEIGWSPGLAQMFGIPVPPGASGRWAIQAVLAPLPEMDVCIMQHLQKYGEEMGYVHKDTDEELLGESTATV